MHHRCVQTERYTRSFQLKTLQEQAAEHWELIICNLVKPNIFISFPKLYKNKRSRHAYLLQNQESRIGSLAV